MFPNRDYRPEEKFQLLENKWLNQEWNCQTSADLMVILCSGEIKVLLNASLISLRGRFSCSPCIQHSGKDVLWAFTLDQCPEKWGECTVVLFCFLTVNFDALFPSCFSPKAKYILYLHPEWRKSFRWKHTVCIVTFSLGLSALYSLWELCRFLQCGANLLYQTTVMCLSV